LFRQRIHAHKPSCPWVIRPHAVVDLVAGAFYFVVILLPIEPIPVTTCTGFWLRLGGACTRLTLAFKELLMPSKIADFFFSPELFQMKEIFRRKKKSPSLGGFFRIRELYRVGQLLEL
jgi:hypothetical protein